MEGREEGAAVGEGEGRGAELGVVGLVRVVSSSLSLCPSTLLLAPPFVFPFSPFAFSPSSFSSSSTRGAWRM